MSGTIAILVGERPKLRYRIFHLAKLWEQMGFTVVIHQERTGPVDADLLIPHVDLSVMPDWMRRLIEGHSTVVNQRVRDIRRTAFSGNLLSAGDSHDGPVLVKSNANYGGIPEVRESLGVVNRLGVSGRVRLAGRALTGMARAHSLSRLAWTRYLHPSDYRVFESLSAVPKGVFRNEHLVVEKFLPEREGEHYCLRSYAFLGTEGFAVRTKNTAPIVKGASGSEPEFVEPHEDIVAARREMGFDYGKFDYAINGGRAILFDVNTTPTFGPVFAGELSRIMAARLAPGIRQWFSAAY